tara:strand:- start:298 stop:585 length:288 start_codon:yes stop_codon:yes gene_type:complete
MCINSTKQGEYMMISDTVKFKALTLLASGPQRSTDVMRIVRNRDADYLIEFKKWLSGKSATSYRIPVTGRTATIYCLEPSGVRELEQLSKIIEVV